MNDQSNHPQPEVFPLGGLPESFEVQQATAFPQELLLALLNAQNSGGRYMVAIYTEDGAKAIQQHMTFGGAWDRQGLFLLAHELFVGEMVRVSPERIAQINRQTDATDSQSSRY